MFIPQNEYAAFSDCVPWLMPKWDHFVSQSRNGKLPHAILLNGTKGIGKVSFAVRLSQWLLCENRTQSEQPCGHCKQCKLFQSNSHSDFKLVQPEEEGKAIKVDMIRDLGEFIYQSSLQGGLKIALISPAEALNVNASNALLKTLEEPSSNSLIILVSHLSGQLLPTIRSRCQISDMPKPTLEQSTLWLKDNLDSGEQPLTELMKLSGGAPMEARSLAEQGAIEESKKMLDEMAAVLKRSVSPSIVAERWSSDMADLRLKWTISWLQQIIHMNMLEGEGAQDENKIFAYLASKASVEKLYALYDESMAQLKLFLGTSNPNKTLVFEYLFNKWIELMRK